jgi:hypothetical protein
VPNDEPSPFPGLLELGTSSRRGFFGWFGRIGLGAVGGTAALVTAGRLDASAAPPCVAGPVNYACCSLNYNPPNCPTAASTGEPYCPFPGDPSQPPGFMGSTQYSWYCCCLSSDRTYQCTECVYDSVITASCCVGQSQTVCSYAITVNTTKCECPTGALCATNCCPCGTNCC